jgi:hypothetical protein
MLPGAVLAGVFGWSAMGFAQTPAPAAKVTVPDAQVEANVLKALAAAPDLTNQPMTTTTVYGVVTLSGTVQTEALRTEAENIVARTAGVQKVVDEMTLSGETTPAAQGSNPTLLSDGTMAPAQGQQAPAPMAQGSPDSDNTAPGTAPSQASGPSYGPGAPEYRQPYGGQQQASQQPSPGYAQPGHSQPQYSQPRPRYAAPPPGYYNAPAYAGQQAGETVTIPVGALVRIRINQTLDSAKAKPGEHFDGVVVNDVAADGAVAIPRGASVQGVVVDAKKSGTLAGRGDLSLQLTQVTLGGKNYPIASDVWAHNGADKTVQSVNSAAVGGGMGALVGAAAGGGAGAAIGAGVGGLLGLGSSAASHSGQVFVPSEGLLTFHLAQPATVATVSQAEMDRLAQGIPNGAQGLQRRPPPYYGPGYYRPYPYPY